MPPENKGRLVRIRLSNELLCAIEEARSEGGYESRTELIEKVLYQRFLEAKQRSPEAPEPPESR